MALIKEKKDTINFNQTIDKAVYLDFYKLCKQKGFKVQDRIRHLIAADLEQDKFFKV